jgi:dihydroorotate dehydrogenase electron transfer subunit
MNAPNSKFDHSHRGTIFCEQAKILSHQDMGSDQFILRVKAPKCAQHAKAGSFAHIQCSASLPMRRPLSIMRVDANASWVDFLYKVVGHGTKELAQRQVGEIISVMGPIGNPFSPLDSHPWSLLIGGGVGLPPMVFLAEQLKQQGLHEKAFVIMGSEVPFPFKPQPSGTLMHGIPKDVIASMPLLDDWHVANRLCSLQGYPGCYNGYVTDLAKLWLDSLEEDIRSQVAVYACGPTPMLKATALLAKDYDLPCQVSLEEYMACAVGGCAGCVVRVQTATGAAMKRVCVDGPVFDAATVF